MEATHRERTHLEGMTDPRRQCRWRVCIQRCLRAVTRWMTEERQMDESRIAFIFMGHTPVAKLGHLSRRATTAHKFSFETYLAQVSPRVIAIKIGR